MNADEIKALIRLAFASVEFPGDWCLRGSNEGDEPYMLEREFAGRTDRDSLDAAFLDQSPGGLASALGFFSVEAFRFYLPAYLVADLDGRLEQADPVFYLTHGLQEAARHQFVNPRRYGVRTIRDSALHKFSVFGREQSRAIIAYLTFRAETEEFRRADILHAVETYWRNRAA